MTTRLPQPVHETDRAASAPGRLELVRSFLTLHDHEPGNPDSLPPQAQSLAWWLASRGLLAADVVPTDDELAWGLAVRDALRTLVPQQEVIEPHEAAIGLLNAAAREAALQVRFGEDGERIRPVGTGVRGAVGQLLAIAFLAELDGSWQRLRRCDDPTCLSVFYDGSKNHSGRWCSMQTCGNRNKVRRFRERRASEAPTG